MLHEAKRNLMKLFRWKHLWKCFALRGRKWNLMQVHEWKKKSFREIKKLSDIIRSTNLFRLKWLKQKAAGLIVCANSETRKNIIAARITNNHHLFSSLKPHRRPWPPLIEKWFKINFNWIQKVLPTLCKWARQNFRAENEKPNWI